jgi:hypothetical protein
MTEPIRTQQRAMLATTYRARGGILFHPYASKATIVDPDTGAIVCNHLSTDWCRHSFTAQGRGEPDPHLLEPYLFTIEYPTKTHTRRKRKTAT